MNSKDYDKFIKRARSIFVERQANYGESVNEIDLHTVVGLIKMKVHRLYFNKLMPEKVKDELIDIVNYAVFGLEKEEMEK